jgi:hypothetical protein
MYRSEHDILQTLKAALRHLEESPRPRACAFEDSPACLNYGCYPPTQPCTDCALAAFVPLRRLRGRTAICRHIFLNDDGDTLSTMRLHTSSAQMHAAAIVWLRETIARLEQARRAA